MRPGSARLADVTLPEFGMPTAMPELPAGTYAGRLRRLRERSGQRGLDRLLVYADREHSANVAYLTGFDPRFEEALVVIGPEDAEPAVLVGNECWGIAGAAPLPMRRHRFQDFSLPNQPRDASLPLGDILAAEGIGPGSRVGLVGWKAYADPRRSDLPAYLVDAVRDLAGAERVTNATDLLIAPDDGLRVTNEAEQIAAFEWASCHTSQGVRNLLHGLRPGMTEQEAVALLGWNGWPLSCHLMLSAGPRARYGLLSPSDRVIGRGEPFTTAFGIWGALTCRAGWVAEGSTELPGGARDYVERLVAPYFAAIAEWYGALRIGQVGGALQEIVDRHLGDPFFGIFLNPGHQLHLDEWVASPIFPGSRVELRSGMVLQVDVIPATGTEYFTTNIEDGVALADADLRTELAARYPDLMSRVAARRAFMADHLGIDLHPDVLPLSNLPAVLAPFLLRPDSVMTLTR